MLLKILVLSVIPGIPALIGFLMTRPGAWLTCAVLGHSTPDLGQTECRACGKELR